MTHDVCRIKQGRLQIDEEHTFSILECPHKVLKNCLMSIIQKSIITPYAIEKMFDIVENVQQYPQFLSWCTHTEILEKRAITDHDFSVEDALEKSHLVASCAYYRTVRIDVLYKGLPTQFTTSNICISPSRIIIRHHAQKSSIDPIRYIQGYWLFEPLEHFDHVGSKISVYIEYEFKNFILKKMLDTLFTHIMGSFAQSFVMRAQNLYGK